MAYFLQWLVMQGRTVYTSVLDDPTKLLDVFDPHLSFCEVVCPAIACAHEELGGDDNDFDFSWTARKGEEIQESEIEKRYAALWNKFRN